MKNIIFKKKFLGVFIIFLALGLFFGKSTSYATLNLGNSSDQLTTSRPSASAPLATDQAANAGEAVVTDFPGSLNNSALWLASDSAVLLPDTGQSLSSINVASMSAANTPAANQRTVFFTGSVANTHHKGTAIYTSITSTHQLEFTTTTLIPSGGKIIITFPGTGSNIASPSSQLSGGGFSFNGEVGVPTDTTCYDITGAQACAGSVAMANNTTFTFTTGVAISGSHTVIVNIGCTAQTSGVCTTFAPRLINPIKTAQAAGSADQWKIAIRTQNASSVDLDSASVIAGIIESVQVQGTVEPYMTMTISGVNNATPAFCGDTTNPGAGLNSTSTFVNLGSLSSSQVNLSGQTIQIDTNGQFGYDLTATSSGRFINAASGFYLADANGGNGLTSNTLNTTTNPTNPIPANFAAGTSGFGIHPCIGATGTTNPTIPGGWGTGGGASNKFANPWNSGTSGYYALLAYTSGPSAASKTAIEYAASVTPTTPAGIYTTVFTYVATAGF